MKEENLCLHPGCQKYSRARGYCQTHYSHAVKQGLIKVKQYHRPNDIQDHGDYIELILTDRYGEEIARTKIDPEVKDRVLQHRWCLANKDGKKYVMTVKNKKHIMLHRFLTDFDGLTDHKNGDGLDNRLQNLRSATPSQNAWNAPKQKSNTSGFKGVSWDTRGGKKKGMYRAQINLNGKYKNIGRFHTALEAALAYDKVAQEFHGEFARLNFPLINHAQ